jgi:hypothetical protein
MLNLIIKILDKKYKEKIIADTIYNLHMEMVHLMQIGLTSPFQRILNLATKIKLKMNKK